MLTNLLKVRKVVYKLGWTKTDLLGKLPDLRVSSQQKNWSCLISRTRLLSTVHYNHIARDRIHHQHYTTITSFKHMLFRKAMINMNLIPFLERLTAHIQTQCIKDITLLLSTSRNIRGRGRDWKLRDQLCYLIRCAVGWIEYYMDNINSEGDLDSHLRFFLAQKPWIRPQSVISHQWDCFIRQTHPTYNRINYQERKSTSTDVPQKNFQTYRREHNVRCRRRRHGHENQQTIFTLYILDFTDLWETMVGSRIDKLNNWFKWTQNMCTSDTTIG